MIIVVITKDVTMLKLEKSYFLDQKINQNTILTNQYYIETK